MSLSLESSQLRIGTLSSVILDPLYLSGHELRFVVDATPAKNDFIRELKAALLTWGRLAKEAKNFRLKNEDEAWELALTVRRHLQEEELEEFSVFELRELYPTQSLLNLADAFPELFGRPLVQTEFFSAHICEVI